MRQGFNLNRVFPLLKTQLLAGHQAVIFLVLVFTLPGLMATGTASSIRVEYGYQKENY
jgi:hypothetical protein